MNVATKTLIEDLFEIEVRRAVPADLGYIFATWGRALRPQYPDVEQGDYVDAVRANLAKALEHEQPWIAHPPGHVDVIWGWCIGSPPGHLRFVYVRGDRRRARIATRMLKAAGFETSALVTTTPLTPPARAIRTAGAWAIRCLPVL